MSQENLDNFELSDFPPNGTVERNTMYGMADKVAEVVNLQEHLRASNHNIAETMPDEEILAGYFLEELLAKSPEFYFAIQNLILRSNKTPTAMPRPQENPEKHRDMAQAA